jgi:hypothetical protein
MNRGERRSVERELVREVRATELAKRREAVSKGCPLTSPRFGTKVKHGGR